MSSPRRQFRSAFLCLLSLVLLTACRPAAPVTGTPASSLTAAAPTPSAALLIPSIPALAPLTETSPPPPTLIPEPTLPPPAPTVTLPAPLFEFWGADQLLTVFKAQGIQVGELNPFSGEEQAGQPLLAQEAWKLDLPAACPGCSARLLLFGSAGDLEQVRSFYQARNQEAAGEKAWVISDRNALVLIDGQISQHRAIAFQTAMQTLLPASLLTPTQDPPEAYESWDYYYPLDRGQQVDPARGMGQRTVNRWEGRENIWQFGQSTWRYQDPEGSADPPPYFPAEYQGQPLTYYYHYHCEPGVNPNPARDCLNWRMFIELATIGNQGTEFQNWGLGGWRWKNPKPPRWEVFFRPESLGGPCQAAYLRDQLGDDFLQDASLKIPLIVRLPKTPGVRFVGNVFCGVAFDSYLQNASHLIDAYLGLVTSENLSSTIEPETGRKLIQARNSYYTYFSEVDGEPVYQQTSYEIFWMRQALPGNLLDGGMQAFWFSLWEMPPEENRDVDGDPAWNPYQWCRQDLTVAPAGLGVLVCEGP